MVTKNELVAIIAALTTDYDTPPAETADDARDPNEARNDAYVEPNEAFAEHHRKAG